MPREEGLQGLTGLSADELPVGRHRHRLPGEVGGVLRVAAAAARLEQRVRVDHLRSASPRREDHDNGETRDGQRFADHGQLRIDARLDDLGS